MNMDGPMIRDNKTRPWSLFGAEAASNGPGGDPADATPSGSEPVEDDSGGEPEGTSEEVGEGSETSTESETSADEETGTTGTPVTDADATPKKKGRLSGMKMPSLFGKQVGVGALLLGAGLAWWFIGRGRSAATTRRAEGNWSFDENVVDAPVNSDNFETATHDPNEYAPHNPTGYDPEGKPFEAEFSEAQRTKLAKKGFAMPDGSFPIRNREDLKNAISTYGLAKNKGRAKAWIKKRAKQLNAEKLLPAKWE
jgi:hypothetical protein